MSARPHFVRGMFSGIEWCFLLAAYALAGYQLTQGHIAAALTLFLTGVVLTACMWVVRVLFPLSTQKTLQPHWSQLVHEARKTPVSSITLYHSTLNTDYAVAIKRRRLDATVYCVPEESFRAAAEALETPGTPFAAYGKEITFNLFYPVVAQRFFGQQITLDSGETSHAPPAPRRKFRETFKGAVFHARTGVLAPRPEELAEMCEFIATADITRNTHEEGDL